MLRLLDPLYSEADELAQSTSVMAGALTDAASPSSSRHDDRHEEIRKAER
jgi:hypothetical protein